MGLLPWETTITCPYNPSHQITVDRIQVHLTKCRKNHPDMQLSICPYNASHHIPRQEEQHHCSVCPDRKIVELAKYSWALHTPGYHGNFDPPPPPAPVNLVRRQEELINMTREENWEIEANVKESYNPAKKASSTAVLRNIQGATPSERKKFYASEAQRHELLKKNEEKERIEGAKAVSEKMNDPDDFFMTPRPSIVIGRPSEIRSLRRPTIGGENSSSKNSFIRQGSVTSQLLALAQERNKKVSNPRGSILMNNTNPLDVTSTTINSSSNVDLDTTKDSTSTTVDLPDDDVSSVLSFRNDKMYPPLRKPSGIASFISKK